MLEAAVLEVLLEAAVLEADPNNAPTKVNFPRPTWTHSFLATESRPSQ